MRDKIQMATAEHIVGEGAVRSFLYECIFNLKLGLGFHPDNPMIGYISVKTGKQIFSHDEALELEKTMDECFEQCDKLGLDIYEIGMEVMKPLLDKIK